MTTKPAAGQQLVPFIRDLSLWSDIVDAVQWCKQERDKQKINPGYGSCRPMGENTTGTDFLPGEIAYVSSTVQPSADSIPIEEMKHTPILNLAAPVWHSQIDHVVILHKNIIAGEISQIATPKILPAYGTVVNASDKYVMIDPLNTKQLKTSDAGMFSLLGSLVYDGDTFLIVDTSKSQPLWRYELTSTYTTKQATAKLLRLDGTVYANTVTVSDEQEQFTGGQIGDTGYCLHVGNKFVPLGGNTDLYAFTLTSDLAATQGATATADALPANQLTGTTSPITVTNPGKYRAFSGAKGLARKAGSAYWIVEVDQPAQKVLAQLAVHTTANRDGADPREALAIIKTASPAPVALTSYPFGFIPTQDTEVPNPQYLWGEANDYVELSWDAAADDYFVSRVFRQRQDMLWGTLASNHPGGLQATLSIIPTHPASDGGFPASPISVIDTYNVAINAKTDDRVLLVWDSNSSGAYKPIIATHTTRKLRGTLHASFSTLQATFELTPVANLDGSDPPLTSGRITVHNLYNWTSGTVGNICSVEWDTVLQRWHPTQLEWECPS